MFLSLQLGLQLNHLHNGLRSMSSLILLEVPKKGQIPDLTCQPRTISDETPATRFAMADTVEQYMQELLWEAMAMSHLWGVVLDYA